MSDTQSEKRQLKIKTGVVARLWKENGLYRKEQEDTQLKLNKMQADGETDEWKLKNTANLIKESEKMVQDTQVRLSFAVSDLRALVVHAKTHPDQFQNSEELHAAEAALSESSV